MGPEWRIRVVTAKGGMKAIPNLTSFFRIPRVFFANFVFIRIRATLELGPAELTSGLSVMDDG
jgi:hypothetical protein